MVRRRRKREKHVGTGALIGALLPIVAGGTGLARSGLQPVPPTVIVEQAPAQPPAAPAPANAAAPAPSAGEAPSPPAGNASAACLARYGNLLPSNAADAKARETLVCRRGYVLAFDADTRDPDWVMEHLTKSDLDGNAKRSNAFKPDPLLKGADAANRDYAGLGYDRGHQAPAGDARFSQQVMNESFFFSNMAPQIGIGFNRGAWKFLEENVRAWVSCGSHSDLYVFTGPIYQPHGKTIGPDKVAVPAAFYKIVYDAQGGRAVGFILPNQKIGSTIDLVKYAKPIAEIETETGLTFFSHLDRRTQTVLKASAGVPWGHTETCPSDGGD
jgi:endonuclease G